MDNCLFTYTTSGFPSAGSRQCRGVRRAVSETCRVQNCAGPDNASRCHAGNRARQRQLLTDHDCAVSTRGYQSDQPSYSAPSAITVLLSNTQVCLPRTRQAKQTPAPSAVVVDRSLDIRTTNAPAFGHRCVAASADTGRVHVLIGGPVSESPTVRQLDFRFKLPCTTRRKRSRASIRCAHPARGSD